MNPFRATFFTVWALAVATFNPTNAPAADEAKVEKIIKQLEDDWNSALPKSDIAAMDRIMATDYTFITPDGKAQTKEEVLADFKKGTVKVDSFHIDDLKVRVYGKTAIVFGLDTEKTIYNGKDISGQYRFTDIFVKRDGRWLAVATHVSKVEKQ